jgi:hypothetical protein
MIVTAACSDESIGTENTATAFPVPSASVLRIHLYQKKLSCNVTGQALVMFGLKNN